MVQNNFAELKNSNNSWDFNTDTTLVKLLENNAHLYSNMVAMREKDFGIWQEVTWSQMLEQTLNFAAGIESLGFEKSQTLMVLGDNRIKLYTSMLGVGVLGGYAMPVFPDATPEEIRYFAREVKVKFVLADDQEQVDKAIAFEIADEKMEENDLAHIDHIIYADPRGIASYPHTGLISWEKIIAIGAKRLHEEKGLRDSLLSRSEPDGPAVLIHSSGTTGKPKGVVISHRALLSGVRNAYLGKAFEFGEEILAYLPMAWVGDFAMTVGAGVALRFVINIPERQETVLRDLREIAPTFYLAAPRSWDNMLTMIQVRMEGSTPLKKMIYHFFMNIALNAERIQLEGGKSSVVVKLLRQLGELIVYGPIKDQLGLTRMRNAFTGGEAIGEDSFIFYRALGVKLRQLYGQTETCAFNAIQDMDEVRLHTVGRPLPNVEVKINDLGEILIRSGSVFSGYFQQVEASKEVLQDGWLHTGDAGYLESDGHLVVLGRVSEVVYTSKKEKYIPNYIENRLKFSPFIKDVAVLGKDKDTLSAIVCIDKESVGHWAETHGVSYMSYADLSQKPEVLELIKSAISRINKTLPFSLNLRRFVSLHKEFDADDGEVTRTRKLRRNVVEERYKPIIDAIYNGNMTVEMKAQITYESGEIGVTERILTVEEV
jgi:long-chain acyl-CoA synthetase